MTRLALLCVAEAVVVALLALQVFAAPGRRDPPAVASPLPASAPNTPALPALAAAAASPTPVDAPSAGEPAQRDEVAAKWNANDPAGVLLTGSVRFVDGTPADASLSAKLDELTVGASAREDGSYALIGLHPGEWTFKLRGTGIVETTAAVTITDDAVQRRDFVVEQSLAVRVLVVTADGEDATTAIARLTRSGFDAFTVAGQCDAFPQHIAAGSGFLRLGDARWLRESNPRDGFVGTLHFTSLPAHAVLLQRNVAVEQQAVRPGQKEVKFVVDVTAMARLAGSVSLRVVDAVTGERLAGTSVSIDAGGIAHVGNKTDGDGHIVLDGLPAGLVQLGVHSADHEAMSITARVASGQRTDLGDLRLGPIAPLEGTVLDADGKPALADLSCTELKWLRTRAGFTTNRTWRTATDGTFSLKRAGAGAIAITARDAKGNVAVGVFDNPASEPVVLRLASPGECTVTREPDLSRAFTVTMLDSARRPVAAATLDAAMAQTVMRLPAGLYAFEVHDDAERLVQSGTVTFGSTPCTVQIR